MNVREQLAVLVSQGVEFVVVGGQAGVLRQAIEFSHDLDVLIRATRENAERVRLAVKTITGIDPETDLVLGRDFQQYVDTESGTEIDIHLKLIAVPDYEAAVRFSSQVDFLSLEVPVLELPALYASKRTDRPRDAVHRRAIEDRLRRLVLDGSIEPDEIVLACCLDPVIATQPGVAPLLDELAVSTRQPLLQTRLIAFNIATAEVARNPALHATVRSLIALDEGTRNKIVGYPERLAALLARLPLLLPEAGYHVTPRG